MSNTDHGTTAAELPHADDELMTLPEAAALCRKPNGTMRYWRHLGQGPRGFRIGRSVYYWRSDVLRWLEEQSQNPQNHA